MLDHLVGKPSSNWKRTQVILTLVSGWYLTTYGKTRQLPQSIQSLSKKTGISPWRLVLGSWLCYYFCHNVFLIIGLNAPDPLSRLYKRSFYRATWILTALDAGFFTAMPFKPNWLRHILSLVFSAYYLVFADAAEEKVRKTRATISIEQMRVSWEKVAQNPILSFMNSLIRPPLTIRDVLMVNRPEYHQNLPPIEVHRYYYAGDEKSFAEHNTILLQFPGGGFVSMPPPCHEDALAAWAKSTGLPVLSVNYKKAPEYPYPWPIEECFDLYTSIIQSKGKVIGLSGNKDISIILTGDSAGGNIVSAVTLKILAHNQQLVLHNKRVVLLSPSGNSSAEDLSIVPELTMTPMTSSSDSSKNTSELGTPLPVPIGLVLIYPALDFEMSCWMPLSQLSLIRAESKTQLFRSGSLDSLWQSKDHLSHASPLSVVPDLEKKQSLWKRLLGIKPTLEQHMAERSHSIRDKIQTKDPWSTSRLAMTSRMSFFNDRVITPDLMRAMAILYLGPHANPDFNTDYLLSPIHAPEDLLAQFPKTYMMCGEKDPFVDDTVIFAGRIRQARRKYRRDNPHDKSFASGDRVRVKFLEGISHAFLQMMPFLPEGRQAAKTIGDWIKEIADEHNSAVLSSDIVTTVVETITVGSEKSKNNGPTLTTKRLEKLVELGDHHVAEIITSEKDMLNRRKQNLVKGLF